MTNTTELIEELRYIACGFGDGRDPKSTAEWRAADVIETLLADVDAAAERTNAAVADYNDALARPQKAAMTPLQVLKSNKRWFTDVRDYYILYDALALRETAFTFKAFKGKTND